MKMDDVDAKYRKKLIAIALIAFSIFIISGGLIYAIGGTPGTWRYGPPGNDRWTCVYVKCTSAGRYDSTGNRFDWANHWGSGWTDLSYFPFTGMFTSLTEICKAQGQNGYSFSKSIRGNWGYAASGSFTYVYTQVDGSAWLVAPPLVPPYIIIQTGSVTCHSAISP
ncbi:MAG: hypothetical protein QW304_01750 [Thermoproteota archaeon]